MTPGTAPSGIIYSGRPEQALFAVAAGYLDITTEDIFLAMDIAGAGGYGGDVELLCMLLVMLNALNSGSLCVNLSELSVPEPLLEAAGITDVAVIRRGLEAGKWEAVVASDSGNEFKPVIFTDNHIYFQRYFELEESIRREITRMLSRQRLIDVDLCRQAMEEVVATSEYPLDPVQARAVAVALLKGFSVISGGPGTGKTHVAASVVRGVLCLLRLGGIDRPVIRLAAPTGRAANRLMESVGKGMRPGVELLGEETPPDIVSSTLHRLLGLGRSAGYGRGPAPINAHLVLVDEASMMDAAVTARLLGSIPRECVLVLIGDGDQLPSVEAGAVLSGLVSNEVVGCVDQETEDVLKQVIPAELYTGPLGLHGPGPEAGDIPCIPVTVLEKVYRSSDIITRAARNLRPSSISTGPHDGYDPFLCFSRLTLGEKVVFPGEGAWFADTSGRIDVVPSLLRQWFEDLLLAGTDNGSSIKEALDSLHPGPSDFASAEVCRNVSGLLALLETARVLCITHRGREGDVRANGIAAGILGGGGSNAFGLFHGCLVMAGENDYGRNIFNGDTGIILSHRETRAMYAWFPRSDGTFTVFPAAASRTLSPAFAMTVHKSQGSEYERVLLILPERSGHRLLSGEILYTAVTRAKEMVLVAGSAEVFETAANRRINRYSRIWR